jgi:hypothetical protein
MAYLREEPIYSLLSTSFPHPLHNQIDGEKVNFGSTRANNMLVHEDFRRLEYL